MAKSIKQIASQKYKLKINGSLWIENNNNRFFGPGPVELLELIGDTGSIRQAAKQMNMSYKKAWEIITNLNSQTISPLVVVQSGGEKGGGSVLTAEAEELIKHYRFLRKRFAIFLKAETKRLKKL